MAKNFLVGASALAVSVVGLLRLFEYSIERYVTKHAGSPHGT